MDEMLQEFDFPEKSTTIIERDKCNHNINWWLIFMACRK